jgi:hypothetical protein
MSGRWFIAMTCAFGLSLLVGCDETTDPSGGAGGSGGSGQGAGSQGGNGGAGGSGGAAPVFPPACVGTTPVAGGECVTEDEACDAPSTMAECELVRFRCCGGRWRQKEACDGAETAPNQESCDSL